MRKKEKIGVCLQGIPQGGTDILLGRIGKSILAAGYEVCEISRGEKIDDFDLLLMPTSEYFNRSKCLYFKKNKILIWSMGQYAFRYAFVRSYRSKVGRLCVSFFGVPIAMLARILASKGELFFTCASARNSDLRYFDEGSQLIAPIAIDDPPLCYLPFDKAEYKLAWIGRVSHDFKVEPLKGLLGDLSLCANGPLKIAEFNVIGDGDALKHLESWIVDAKLPFRVNLIGSIGISKLSEAIIKHADIVFSMGTSALESAKLGIPTIIANPYDAELYHSGFLDYERKYRWIFNSSGMSMGEFVDKRVKAPGRHSSLDEILGSVVTEGAELSGKCANYCKPFYIDSVSAEVISFINKRLQEPSIFRAWEFFVAFFCFFKAKTKIFFSL